MRRHRPAYLAPARTQQQLLPSQPLYHNNTNDIIISGGSGHDLNIPLLVEIPRQSATTTVVSPPSSVGSNDSFPLSTVDPFPSHQYHQPRIRRYSQRRRSVWGKVVKHCVRLYHLLLDVLLLLFVCVMGLFFDVEVQVVKQDKRRATAMGRGSGRVVIQTDHKNDDEYVDDDDRDNHQYYYYQHNNNSYHSPPESRHRDECWYRDLKYGSNIV